MSTEETNEQDVPEELQTVRSHLNAAARELKLIFMNEQSGEPAKALAKHLYEQIEQVKRVTRN